MTESNGGFCGPETKRGDIVVFAFPQNGYPADQKAAEKSLIVGLSYLVSDVEVHGWSTELRFVGHEGRFNSVLFSHK